jgi:hypothetical protein
MVTQHTVDSFEQLVRDFGGLFRHRAFRLEFLDWYDAPNEREPYARFLAGEPADWAWREPWQELVRDARESGRVMQRVHVVSEPVSDYVRFELLRVYPANVEAGEDVRILGRSEADVGGVPEWSELADWDFWLFDDDLVVMLVYDDDSGQITEVESYNSPALLAPFLRARDRAVEISAPLAQYVTEHNITEGKPATWTEHGKARIGSRRMAAAITAALRWRSTAAR